MTPEQQARHDALKSTFSFQGTAYQNSPMGPMPGYWRDETDGRLIAAVEAYFNYVLEKGPEPTQDQKNRITWYIQYFINAPCWDNICANDCEAEAELLSLRGRAKTLASLDSICRWLSEAMEIGLDPL